MDIYQVSKEPGELANELIELPPWAIAFSTLSFRNYSDQSLAVVKSVLEVAIEKQEQFKYIDDDDYGF
mgnify:CR=1 FL=1